MLLLVQNVVTLLVILLLQNVVLPFVLLLVKILVLLLLLLQIKATDIWHVGPLHEAWFAIENGANLVLLLVQHFVILFVMLLVYNGVILFVILLVQNVVPVFVLLLVPKCCAPFCATSGAKLGALAIRSGSKKLEVRQFLCLEVYLGRPWLGGVVRAVGC